MGEHEHSYIASGSRRPAPSGCAGSRADPGPAADGREDTYCIDILTQVSATTRPSGPFALGLLDEHLAHCVAHGTGEGADEKLAEASRAIARLVRS